MKIIESMKWRRKSTTVLSAVLCTLSGCAVNSVRDVGNGEFVAQVRDVNYRVAYEKAHQSAKNHCNSRGGGIKLLDAEQPYDNVGAAYYLHFQCFNWEAYAQQEKQKKEAERREADRLRQVQAEQERQAEIARKKAEAEWERGRPAREAEAKRQREAEERRLKGVCPVYWLARQSCAGSANYDSCMTIRIGKGYSSWDDRTCFNR